MALTTILGTDLIKDSRAVINANFAYLAGVIGSGLTGSATLNFGAIEDGEVGVLTFTLTGAVAGSRVVPAWPASLEAGLIGMMRVSALNTIEVRLLNMSKAQLNPASAVFGATVL